MAETNWGQPLRDMVEMSDQELAGVAAKAFLIGLKDGRELAGPITADKLMMALPGHPHRIMHSKKLRQVYGAAFDIMKGHARIKAREG